MLCSALFLKPYTLSSADSIPACEGSLTAWSTHRRPGWSTCNKGSKRVENHSIMGFGVHHLVTLERDRSESVTFRAGAPEAESASGMNYVTIGRCQHGNRLPIILVDFPKVVHQVDFLKPGPQANPAGPQLLN